ncbi:MAG: hypothetical protein K5871_01100 [Lachnospiraceae bacterium]|nr:hypothetical protein [Lachnospiraceae bacterium]
MAEPIITKTLYVNAEPVSSPKVSSPQREQEGNQINVPSEEKAPAYENIVSTSKDGDTVQVKPEANERLSEGFVFAKASDDKTDVNEAAAPDRNSEAREEKAAEEDIAGKNERLSKNLDEARERSEEARKAIKEQIDKAIKKDKEEKEEDKNVSNENVGTASDSELERLYLSGKISSFDYNREVNSRKEEAEDIKEDASGLSKDIASAGAAIEGNKAFEQYMGPEEFGAGYSTRQEQDLARDILQGQDKAEKDSSTNAFEINIIR